MTSRLYSASIKIIHVSLLVLSSQSKCLYLSFQHFTLSYCPHALVELKITHLLSSVTNISNTVSFRVDRSDQPFWNDSHPKSRYYCSPFKGELK